MNREQWRAMQLAGTVSVPQRFPQLAMISFLTNATDAGEADVNLECLVVDHVINAKLRIRRSFRISDVSAVFLPQSNDCVDLQNGEWFLGGEITKGLPTALGNRGGTARGIAYVTEQAATLMQVEVGMTAAESVDYYPPLPDDRSVDHYATGQLSAGFCEPCSAFAPENFCEPCSMFAPQEPYFDYPDFGAKPGKPKKEKKTPAKVRGKKKGKKQEKKRKRKKELAALDPRSRIIW